jgi:hypothetical protein
MDAFRVYSNKEIGPGGYLCTCCGPAPKERKKLRRRTRRRLKQADLKERPLLIQEGSENETGE